MAGDPLWANTSLLLHCDGAAGSTSFVDQKGKTVTANGAAQITSSSRFGSGAVELNGTNAYLYVPNSADFQFSAGDFTIEYFVQRDELVSTTFALYSGPNQSWWMYFSGSSVLFAYSTDGSNSIAALTASNVFLYTSSWYHLAVVRYGSTLTLYVDGIVRATATITSAIYSTSGPLLIGSFGSYFLDGRIDELRITKGSARYTAPFTTPSAPFPDFYPVEAAGFWYLPLLVEATAGLGVSSIANDVTLPVDLLASGSSTVGSAEIVLAVETAGLGSSVVARVDHGLSIDVACVANRGVSGNWADTKLNITADTQVVHYPPADIAIFIDSQVAHGVAAAIFAEAICKVEAIVFRGAHASVDFHLRPTVSSAASRGVSVGADDTIQLSVYGEASHTAAALGVSTIYFVIELSAQATHLFDNSAASIETFSVVAVPSRMYVYE